MISVAIVEDNEQYRALLKEIVASSGELSLTGSYHSAEEAMVGLVATPPDIALIDIQLRGMTGIELIRRCCLQMQDTQFLMCTSYQNNENVFNALQAGALGYILKGATSTEIHEAIIELHHGGSPMSPYIARKVIRLMQPKKQVNNFNLTERELEVLQLLSTGMLYKEISDKLGISANTVKNHCKNIYKRLHVQNKIEALNKFRSQ